MRWTAGLVASRGSVGLIVLAVLLVVAFYVQKDRRNRS